MCKVRKDEDHVTKVKQFGAFNDKNYSKIIGNLKKVEEDATEDKPFGLYS